MRSAKQAGYFAHGEDRLVQPAGPGTKPIGNAEAGGIKDEKLKRENGHGGNCGGPNDPLIQALIDKLPDGGPWPSEARVNWLKMLVTGFNIADDEIDIKKASG
jgi:hypothetical protein